MTDPKENEEKVAVLMQPKKRAPRKPKVAAPEVKTEEAEEKVADKYEKPEASFDDQVKAFVTKPENRDNLIKWADLFLEKFRGNWFTIDKICKKTALKNPNEAIKVLSLLMLMDICHSKVERGGFKSYKITLEKTEKIRLLEIDLEEVNKRAQSIRDAIARLVATDNK